VTFIQVLDTISGQLEGFHYSSIDSIVKGECSAVNSVDSVNGVNTLNSRRQYSTKKQHSRNGRVLKFVLVIWAIKKY